MLIRITRPRIGEVEGVELSTFDVGHSYDLPTSLATYLLVTRSAELAEDPPELPAEPGERREYHGSWPGWAVAADWLRRK